MAQPTSARPAPAQAGDPATPLARFARIAAPLALAVATLAAFWPAVDAAFVQLDDDANFELNHRFRGLGPEQLRWMWSDYHYGHWHPLTWWTFGLDYVRHGLDGPAYHRTNLAIHVASVLAFYALALELLRWIAGWARSDAPAERPEGSRSLALHACAFLAAATWGLHPLRVESVAWVTERRDLLSALFLALSAWAYLRSARFGAERWAWLAAALASYALSLGSKAWGMTFPVVLLALDVYPLRRLRVPGVAAVLREKLWFLPLAAYTMHKAARAQDQIGAVVSFDEHTVVERVAQACYGLVFYVVKTLWPSDLACHYLLDLDFDWTRPVHLAAIAAVVATTAVLIALARRFPAGIATWACYGILVSPVLGLLQSGSQKVADRYAHLSAMPFSFLLAGGLLVALSRREAAARKRGALATLALGAALSAGLAFASNRQTRVWKDSETLFRHAAEVEPENYFILHNLTVALYRRGAYAEALEIEKRSVAAHPGKGNEEARYTVGLLHAQLGDAAAAEEAWEGALAVAPDHARSLDELRRRKLARGDVDGVIAMQERAIAANPAFEAGYQELERLYAQRSQPAKALEMWERAAASGKAPVARVEAGRARALVALGRIEDAEKHAFRAVRADKSAADALAAVEAAVRKRGTQAVLDLWHRAQREGVPPGVVENGLGRAKLALGQLEEAERHLLTAWRLDSSNADYVVDLCEMFLRTNRAEDAEETLRGVLAREPGHARARTLMREVQAARARG
jgi:tetratricopeptide (TPR) repeat protein